MFNLTTEQEPAIANLYPELTSEQQAEAEYYLTRYLEIVQRIFERLEAENLTESNLPPTMII